MARAAKAKAGKKRLQEIKRRLDDDVCKREEEEEEEEERLYLHLETRERVQTNEAKSKRRRASPTQTTSQRDNTPAAFPPSTAG